MSWCPGCGKVWQECECDAVWPVPGDKEEEEDEENEEDEEKKKEKTKRARSHCPQCGEPVNICRCGDRCRHCGNRPQQCECFDQWAKYDDMIMPIGGGGRIVIKKVQEIPGYRPARLAVALEIGDMTTVPQVERAARKAMAWRDGLIRHQGLWFHGNFEEFLARLASLQEASTHSYAQLATKLNATVARCIELSITNGLPAADEDLLLVRDTPGMHHNWPTRAQLILRVFHTATEADRLVAEAIQRVEQGGQAFPLLPPMDAEVVRDKLHYFRKRNKENNPPRR